MRVYKFSTAEQFFALLGPSQHDAHVQTRHRELFLRRWEEGRAERRAAVRAEFERISANYRARHTQPEPDRAFWEAAE